MTDLFQSLWLMNNHVLLSWLLTKGNISASWQKFVEKFNIFKNSHSCLSFVARPFTKSYIQDMFKKNLELHMQSSEAVLKDQILAVDGNELFAFSENG